MGSKSMLTLSTAYKRLWLANDNPLVLTDEYRSVNGANGKGDPENDTCSQGHPTSQLAPVLNPNQSGTRQPS